MRVLAVLAVMVILFGSWAGAEGMDAWVMCRKEVNVRSHPSKGGEVIATVYAGDYIALTGRKQGRWYECDVPCEYGAGWIRSDYLSFYKPEIFLDGRKYRTTNGKVYARYSIRGNKCATLKKGTVVTVYMYAEEWSVTSRGFIMSKFLEEVESDG